MKGRKCSLIFMRKVANRLVVLEERYKDLKPKERARKINEQLRGNFCVARAQMFNWKRVVNIAKTHSLDIYTEISPSHLMEVARLPDDKIDFLLREIKEKKLSVKKTRTLVDDYLNDGKKIELPKGKFSIIYADPPWKYDIDFLSASPNAHYSVMSVSEICAEKVPSAKDSILFLWATNPLLKDALQVMEAWGFKYKTNIVWVKDRIGLGFYVRGQHELLLIGTKGKMSPPEESRRVSSVLIAPSLGHSVKPEAVYALIERMYPYGKYLELYARKKRKGWVSWGKQLT